MSRFNPQSWNTHHYPSRLGLGVGIAIALLFLLLLLKLLLPWLLLVAAGWTGWYFWKRHRDFEQRLYTCFYECLKVHQGRISVLDFAMNAQITGPQARAFLDARAKDFFGDFEPTAHGDILYTFRQPSRTPPQPLPKLPMN